MHDLRQKLMSWWSATAVLYLPKTRRWSLPPLRREYSMLLRLRPHVLVCWGLLTLDIGKICKQLGPAYCSIPSNYLSLYPSIISNNLLKIYRVCPRMLDLLNFELWLPRNNLQEFDSEEERNKIHSHAQKNWLGTI